MFGYRNEKRAQACSQPLDLFQGLENWSYPVVFYKETSIFTIKAQIYMASLYSILLILFHRRTIFKMLAH